MKIQDLTRAGQTNLQRVIAQEDEEWERCKYWWDANGTDPAYAKSRASSGAADMRRWNANWLAFKAALERGDDFEDAFVAWVRQHTPAQADVADYNEARIEGNVPHLKIHEVYDRAKRQAEISAEEQT